MITKGSWFKVSIDNDVQTKMNAMMRDRPISAKRNENMLRAGATLNLTSARNRKPRKKKPTPQ
jgi:hypothetical protein